MVSESIRYQTHAGVSYITLSSPQTGNALSVPMIESLHRALSQASADETCRVVVIEAAGQVFCTGMDFQSALAAGPHPDLGACKIFQQCLHLICQSSRPVIARVEGDVTAGGLGLIAACDLVIASERVIFMLSEAIVGMIPALITPFLLRRLPMSRIRYMTLSTSGVRAKEARVFGLVDEVVAADDMETAVNRQLKRLLRASPHALAESKRYFARLESADLEQQSALALTQLDSWLEQAEVAEGIRAFAEGFAPAWFQKYERRSDA